MEEESARLQFIGATSGRSFVSLGYSARLLFIYADVATRVMRSPHNNFSLHEVDRAKHRVVKRERPRVRCQLFFFVRYYPYETLKALIYEKILLDFRDFNLGHWSATIVHLLDINFYFAFVYKLKFD